MRLLVVANNVKQKITPLFRPEQFVVYKRCGTVVYAKIKIIIVQETFFISRKSVKLIWTVMMSWKWKYNITDQAANEENKKITSTQFMLEHPKDKSEMWITIVQCHRLTSLSQGNRQVKICDLKAAGMKVKHLCQV